MDVVQVANKTDEEKAAIACMRDQADLAGHTSRHCEHPTCQRFDLLPLHCQCCSRYFCAEHHAIEAHACTQAHLRADKRLPQCPLCNRAITVRESEGETPDGAVDAHIMSGCTSHLAEQVRAQRIEQSRCQHGKGKKACKDTSLIKYHCPGCGKTFCMKHRHHKCKGRKPASPAIPTARLVEPGRA